MTEKVLHEVRVIETDDGFRIEINGDKEQLKKMGLMHFGEKGFGPGRFFGRKHGYRQGRRQGRRGPWGHGHGFGPPPWAWGSYDPDAEDEQAEA